ncbi:MAG: hypothetical protein WC554_18050 [Clostridia bacterium]
MPVETISTSSKVDLRDLLVNILGSLTVTAAFILVGKAVTTPVKYTSEDIPDEWPGSYKY